MHYTNIINNNNDPLGATRHKKKSIQGVYIVHRRNIRQEYRLPRPIESSVIIISQNNSMNLTEWLQNTWIFSAVSPKKLQAAMMQDDLTRLHRTDLIQLLDNKEGHD